MRRLKRVEFQGTMKSRRRLGSTVAETPAKFHNDICILTPELVPSGVCRVFRWGDSCDIELSLRVQLSNPDLSYMPQVSLLIVYGLSPFRYQAIGCNSAVLVLFNPLEQGSSGWLLSLLPVPRGRQDDDLGRDQWSHGGHLDYPLGFDAEVIDSGLPGCPGCLREPLWFSSLTDMLNNVSRMSWQ